MIKLIRRHLAGLGDSTKTKALDVVYNERPKGINTKETSFLCMICPTNFIAKGTLSGGTSPAALAAEKKMEETPDEKT